MRFAVLLLIGCADSGSVAWNEEEEVPAGEDEPVEPSRSDHLYDPDHVVEIEITMAESDAAALALQGSDIWDLIEGADCMDAPRESPYTWFEADVVVDGELLTQTGVRKKGLIGSLSSSKPALKLDFDEFVEGRQLGDVERLTLNNSVSDPALVRQCLGYQLFADAGIPSPRCNFAHVTFNGEDLGVYVNVEPIKKDFLRWAVGDADGDLYEGTLSDFRDGWTGTFEPKTDETDTSLAPILAVTEAMTAADGELVGALGEVLDLDAFYRFWAMEAIVGHVDGYAGNTNNFFAYRDPGTGLVQLMPWGIDWIFHDSETWGQDTETGVLANGHVAWRLYALDEGKDAYVAAVSSLLDEVWDEGALLAEIDRMVAVVTPYQTPEVASVEELRVFVEGRRDELTDALAVPPAYDLPLRDLPCLVPVGEVSVAFDTTWGTLEVEDVLGTGTGTVVRDGVEVQGGAIAGFSDGRAVMAAVGLVGTEVVQGAVVIPADQVTPGITWLDGMDRVGVYLTFDLTTGLETFGGLVANGELVIDQGAAVDGAPVVGSFSGTVYEGGL